MTKRERAHFGAAKAVSELSDHRYKMGCVVTIGSRIISSGSNSISKCHGVQAKLDKEMFGCESHGPLHAEVATLLPLIRKGVDLSNASLYVYREHKNGTLACARPCARCEKLIRSAGLKRIFYTVENGIAEEKWQL
jgi:deoxycytidylate deaminase